jgi:hypothetical protein
MSGDLTIHKFWETIIESDEYNETGVWSHGGEIATTILYCTEYRHVKIPFSKVCYHEDPDPAVSFVHEFDGNEKETARYDGNETLIAYLDTSRFATPGTAVIQNPEWPAMTKSANKSI